MIRSMQGGKSLSPIEPVMSHIILWGAVLAAPLMALRWLFGGSDSVRCSPGCAWWLVDWSSRFNCKTKRSPNGRLLLEWLFWWASSFGMH